MMWVSSQATVIGIHFSDGSTDFSEQFDEGNHRVLQVTFGPHRFIQVAPSLRGKPPINRDVGTIRGVGEDPRKPRGVARIGRIAADMKTSVARVREVPQGKRFREETRGQCSHSLVTMRRKPKPLGRELCGLLGHSEPYEDRTIVRMPSVSGELSYT